MNSIESIMFHGEPAVKAQNGHISVVLVPGWGSNLVSMQLKSRQLELLRVPGSRGEYEAVPVLYGIPILFPPNRIADGCFEFNGRTYQFEINEPAEHNHSHGLVFDKRWELVRAEEEEGRLILETEIRSDGNDEILSQFPHLFTIRVRYIVERNILTMETTVTNRDASPFPWGLGYHTTFNFPAALDGDIAQCRFSLNAVKQWVLDGRFLPTGELQNISYADELMQGKTLIGHALDDAFMAAGSGNNEAVLTDDSSGIRIVYRCDSYFKHWVVYNDDANQGYLCPEPYTWITNAPNLSLPPELTGFRVLHPGESVTAAAKIMVEERMPR
ncbi:aldose 1-epimerase [Paenibacillus sepulcri]|uniref:Aldose 1-epimerase n=1 Tax=Paenibacillus sepulcri TaxID=359917 RepID=A0ABS7C7F6_9BACL|nr:aldose 1-epimerase [Paenibacillus sepulcri]